jgi:hypothetical protein
MFENDEDTQRTHTIIVTVSLLGIWLSSSSSRPELVAETPKNITRLKLICPPCPSKCVRS